MSHLDSVPVSDPLTVQCPGDADPLALEDDEETNQFRRIDKTKQNVSISSLSMSPLQRYTTLFRSGRNGNLETGEEEEEEEEEEGEGPGDEVLEEGSLLFKVACQHGMEEIDTFCLVLSILLNWFVSSSSSKANGSASPGHWTVKGSETGTESRCDIQKKKKKKKKEEKEKEKEKKRKERKRKEGG